MTVVEQQLAATNTRVDQSYQQITTLFEALRKDVNGLSTRVEVLGANVGTLAEKVDNLAPTRRSDLYGLDLKRPSAKVN